MTYSDSKSDTEEQNCNEFDSGTDETDGVDCGSTHSPIGIPQSSNIDCNNLHINSEENTATGTDVDVKQEVIKAVMNAMSLNEEVNGSQNSFMSILDYGKNLYCSGANDSSLKEYWPTSWQSSMQLLKDNGYRDPKEFFICLSDDHPCSYDIVDSSTKHLSLLQCHSINIYQVFIFAIKGQN